MTSTPSDLNGTSLIFEESLTTSTVTNSSLPLVISNIPNLIPIKLSSTNCMLWKSLFEPILRGHKLMHLIDDSTATPITLDSPQYEKDQMLLSWINATLNESDLSYIVGVSFAKVAWNLLKTRYASTTLGHVMSLKRQLSHIRKGSQPMIHYIQQFKNIADQLAACNSSVSEDDLVLYVLNGLPPSYLQFCSSIRIRAWSTALPLEELHTLLICEELALADESPNENSSAFVSYRRTKPNVGRDNSSYRGRHNNQGRGWQNQWHFSYSIETGILTSPTASPNITGNTSRPHICHKMGHLAIDCYHRMDYAYQGRHPEKLAAMMSSTVPTTDTCEPRYTDFQAEDFDETYDSRASR
ncbi:hypothetical protein NE237_009700 [Protea cynaroides]|uniref:Uncharacterized protein n=1 Tax=Protea cynaroides TaxID=273540 RepID=A0A9Q0KYD0_9MAGN|nr:hypothetical protein NE237_009700 [Protea cynaroides]